MEVRAVRGPYQEETSKDGMPGAKTTLEMPSVAVSDSCDSSTDIETRTRPCPSVPDFAALQKQQYGLLACFASRPGFPKYIAGSCFPMLLPELALLTVPNFREYFDFLF
jgi:hypothetical protein